MGMQKKQKNHPHLTSGNVKTHYLNIPENSTKSHSKKDKDLEGLEMLIIELERKLGLPKTMSVRLVCRTILNDPLLPTSIKNKLILFVQEFIKVC